MKISNGYEGLGLFAMEIELDRVFVVLAVSI